MTAAPRVGDEQLTDWPNHATARDGAPPVLVDDLVADLLDARAEVRASRAREAALLAERSEWEQDRCDLVNDCHRADADQDVLQRRIDKALAEIDGPSYQMGTRVRAALTGTQSGPDQLAASQGRTGLGKD